MRTPTRVDRRRILLLGDTLAVGGTEGQFVEVACGLPRSRWDVRVACLRAEGPLQARLDGAGVPVASVARRSLRSLAGPLEIAALARGLRRDRIDLVHTFDYYSNPRGVLAARLARAPIVIASQRNLGNLRAPRQERLQRLTLRLAHRVLVNSPAVADVVRDTARVRPARISLVPNGVDLARFATRTRPRAGDRVTIGTLANLRPEKSGADLVRAAALVRERCPEARIVLWGDGPLRGALETLIAELGLGRTVELAGPATAPEDALRALDVFVLASRSEASSNAILEAMATGLPVVTTAVGGNPWMVEDERTGLVVQPGDVVGLSKALIRLVEDPALAARLGQAGRARVEADFSLDRLIARVEALYLDALEQRTVA